MDVISKTKRSDLMRKIKSKETRIEVLFRKKLWQKGFRYRKNVSSYFGKPDILLKKYKTVILIDSCFWHGCAKHFRQPSTRKKYWIEKIERNRKRDAQVNRHYKKTGWKVVRVWEHDLKNKLDLSVDKAIKIIKSVK